MEKNCQKSQNDLPPRKTLGITTPQNWNFSWRTLCGGLVCEDYYCIPQGYCLATAHQEVMLSLMPVCSRGFHVTITHNALDLTIEVPHRHQIWDPMLVTSGGHHWKPVQTCSFEDPTPISTDIWWLKHTQLASGWYASYWKAFLLPTTRKGNIFTVSVHIYFKLRKFKEKLRMISTLKLLSCGH